MIRLSRAFLLFGIFFSLAVQADEDAVRRGQYIFDAAGCKECHTREDGEPLAGGRAFETPFGVFYSPNITPDPEHGIGRWTEEDLRNALRRGRRPDGLPYYPVFPYTSYTGMSDQDVADLYAYLMSRPAVAEPDLEHELKFPFSIRIGMYGWQWLFFDEGPRPFATSDPELQRGAYLVRALGHCGECHTPRNAIGVLDFERELAGTSQGPEAAVVPNITSDPETGIGNWSEADLDALLEYGMLPDGDFVGGAMSAVVDNSTSLLTSEDRRAMVKFLRALPPVRNSVEE